MKKQTKIVTVSGSRYECGFQHGEQARELVKSNIGYYFNWWGRNLKMSKRDIYERADSIIDVCKGYDSGLVEEMRGLSDSVGVDLEEIVSLNGRYELSWASPAQLLGGCTCIATLPSRSESGDTLIAQNWDYRIAVNDSCIILRSKVDKGPNVIMHTEAGIIGHKGININGIGVVVNALVSDIDRMGDSVPFFLVCRKMLDCNSFSEAIKVLLNAKRSVSYNVMLGGEGVLVDLEASPLDVSIIYPDNGILVHTNHFIGGRSYKIKDNYILNDSSSITRYIVSKIKLDASESHSFESFKEILTNHYDYPSSICYHPDPEKEEDLREETVSSIYMVPEKKMFKYTEGPPCSNEFKQVPF
jgi:isopenicillin-N N-acyltransferase-like protein